MAFRKARKYMRRRFFSVNREITPDEIFLDSSNLPAFDTHQFEGRIEQPIQRKAFLLLGAFFLIVGLAFLGRTWKLQIHDGQAFVIQSENNRLQHNIIFAERGVVYDRNDIELAWNAPNSEETAFAERQYSDLPGLAHVLGYVTYPSRDTAGFYYQKDILGKDGVEHMFDKFLGGENGLQIIEIDAVSKIQSESVVRFGRDGGTLTLSIDAAVQSALFLAIKNTVEDVGFLGGAGVVMDTTTGELLALTSYPEYDPNIMSNEPTLKHIEEYQTDERKPFLNRAAAGLYTPGSIVKPFIALGALEEGIITPEKEIISTGSISVPNPYFENQESVFLDWKAHGPVTMREALAFSSNVYFYEVGGGFEGQKGLGITKIEDYMKRFGFGSKTGASVPFEEEGLIPNPDWKSRMFDGDAWRLGDTYNTAIGQYGFQVTPLQVVRAIAAVANGGTLLQPTLIRTEEPEEVAATHGTISTDTFSVVREGMRGSVQYGTAQGLSFPNFAIAAKTGTAQIGTLKKQVHSWVTGFFPYENPRYAFAVVMERGPATNLTGGVFVMRRFLEWLLAHKPEYALPEETAR